MTDMLHYNAYFSRFSLLRFITASQINSSMCHMLFVTSVSLMSCLSHLLPHCTKTVSVLPV